MEVVESSDFEKLYLLGRCPSLASLAPDVLGALAARSVVVRYGQGECVLEEDGPADALYATAFGTLSISVAGTAIAESRVGDLVGDHEILIGRRTSEASVQITSNYALLLRVPKPSMLDLMDQDPRFVAGLARALSRRHSGMERGIADWGALTSRIGRELSSLESSLDWIGQLRNAKVREDPVTEIRYSVSGGDNELSHVRPRHIRQGYLALDGTSEIRVRSDGAECTVTGKRDDGGRRQEIRLEIPDQLFDALWQRVGSRTVSKLRYLLVHKGCEWRVDVYDADTQCAGLKIAEADVPVEAEQPELPPFLTCLRNITHDQRYRNQQLAQYGPPRD
jgi:CYTH domain-containing protein/CRP-like cAMP-binding protein